ncbi:SHOCT domain-containing protein [Streptomyces sp. RPA4-5]|uniref:SHOCT domain-containing protein n=1 Tax=Streptomyces TaxID=1883 RepID=UPI00143EDD23|nr:MULTISPECIES: SHOCT domain-containing protein [Streptomyces]MCX4638436.1 SHOCT domain-containing protein [Streptomyces platensis]QIY54352.1 SHOCT domain-containing protein [Streptomyces sp. RPA4-5]WJY36972.1 SHOCT domain-containing protein [Streptomyces sp. P9-2B-2]
MFELADPWSGGGPGPWILFAPFVWVLVIAGVVTLLRRTVWRRGGPGRQFRGPQYPARADTPSPVTVLGRRFAAGEIDEEEYWRRLSVLEEHFAMGPKEGAA